MCSNPARIPLHLGVQDLVCFSSRDSWNLWQCSHCDCAYLSPRPNRSSIGRAYSTYYTHASSPLATNRNGFRAWYRFLRSLYELDRRGEANIYSLGQRLLARSLGILFSRRWESRARLYPRQTGDRLLDVGCGSGEFLDVAASVGWYADGIDPDPNAVAAAQKRGLRVWLSDLESQATNSAGIYDAITMHHVIEHFHDPVAALKACYTLLRPGGRIWIATPRLHSPAHRRFKKCWRGLEAPRHLVIFGESGLAKALAKAGFESAHLERIGRHAKFYWRQSYAMERGQNPYIFAEPLPLSMELSVHIEDMVSILTARGGEHIYMVAKRPKNS